MRKNGKINPRIRLTSAKVLVEVEAELGKNNPTKTATTTTTFLDCVSIEIDLGISGPSLMNGLTKTCRTKAPGSNRGEVSEKTNFVFN